MNAWRLALGTLTALPVRPPSTVDRTTAGRAMVLAPLAGAALAVPAVVLLALLGWVVAGPARPPAWPVLASPLLAAALVLGLLALLTRGMHLDGLADTVDGLGSGRPADQALAIMRKSDVGPFGVVALVLALLVQAAALAQCIGAGHGATAVCVALVASRGALPLLCTARFPAARPDGLGAVVAGTVGRWQAVAALLLATVLAVLATLLVSDPLRAGTGPLGPLVAALLAGVLLPLLLASRATRRLGGMTGDTYGACVEAGFTAALVAAALAT